MNSMNLSNVSRSDYVDFGTHLGKFYSSEMSLFRGMRELIKYSKVRRFIKKKKKKKKREKMKRMQALEQPPSMNEMVPE